MPAVATNDPQLHELLDRYKGRITARVAEEDGGRFDISLDVEGVEIASINLRCTRDPVMLYTGPGNQPAGLDSNGEHVPLPPPTSAPGLRMTIEQFRATGRDVADLGEEFSDMGLDGTPGRVYLYKSGAYIERWEDARHGVAPPNGPTWLLTLGREQYDGDLPTLEEKLFEWCRDEGFFE